MSLADLLRLIDVLSGGMLVGPLGDFCPGWRRLPTGTLAQWGTADDTGRVEFLRPFDDTPQLLCASPALGEPTPSARTWGQADAVLSRPGAYWLAVGQSR